MEQILNNKVTSVSNHKETIEKTMLLKEAIENITLQDNWKEDKETLLEYIYSLRDLFQKAVQVSRKLSQQIQQKMHKRQEANDKLDEHQMQQFSQYSQAVSTNASAISELVEKQNGAWQLVLDNSKEMDNKTEQQKMVNYLVEQVQLVQLAFENVVYKHSILACVE